MFPPVEASVLENNPDFATLYTMLTTSILNPDGTTRADPGSKARDAVREDLRTHRLKAAKHHLLTSAITTTPAPDSQTLPPDLLDLLVLLPPMLTHPPTPGTSALLLSHPPFSLLPTLLPPLSHLISRSLHTSALALARISNPSTNASYLHRAIPTLPQTLSQLLVTTHDLSTKTIPDARLAATSTSLLPLLAAHTRALVRLIHALEAKLSSPQRDLLLRAEMLPLSAEESSLRARLDLDVLEREVVYTPDVVAAAERYSEHLRDARARVEARTRDVVAELAGYGVAVEGRRGDEGRERMFREMGRVYGEMVRQMGEVRADLQRLGGRR
ncbi:uncharacterized protein DNG_07989 [Cephalotrichum gorgonifer]|uniref:Uncharacterized protein n=1 Tax=Cephalotrichum gorgonifer TaxID=2041049 RepID=A0AAE8N3H9_9PEZI|nr:uncharacterized protein DNG_07989 [Cephalotrichum gorgonifer]